MHVKLKNFIKITYADTAKRALTTEITSKKNMKLQLVLSDARNL